MPVSLEDLIESTRRLADSNAESAAANRRLADSNLAQAAAINKLVPPFEQLRRNVADFMDKYDLQQASFALTVGRLNTDLAVLLKAVENAQGDVRDLQRDITGTHVLPPPDNRSGAERLIDKFEGMRTSTKLWILAFVFVVVVAIGAHLILSALGLIG